jgi:MerR family transcriptional regulator, copper efflux regulator
MAMTISEAGKRAGCSPPTIRYYESIGLLAAAHRTPKGRRTYGWPDVSRLTLIRRARDFGLSIDQVRQLLGAADGPGDGCTPAAGIIEEQLRAIRTRRGELRLLETTLQAMLNRCTSTCAPGGAASCSIFEDIAATGHGQTNERDAL